MIIIFRKMTAFLLCLLVLSLYSYRLETSIINLNQRVNSLELIIEAQKEDTDQLTHEVRQWGAEINNLYKMNQNHSSCVAMAILMNEEAILANHYDRTEEEQLKLYGNDNVFVNYYGRLYVPDAKIDVALYTGWTQAICDRQDSANIFSFGLDEGKTIADHNNQEFSKLFSVKVGTQGYIRLKSGDIINIICTDVFDGHHDGVYIRDEQGNNVHNVADYMMYTCRNGWRNVRICLWERY